MSKTATENMLCKINNLLGIEDSYQAPEKIMSILFSEERDKIFSDFILSFDGDLSYDWFHKYFQDEHADRKNKKQDFTPKCLSLLCGEMLDANNGVIYEPAAGTGGMIIANWNKNRLKYPPWAYDPMSMWFVAEEMSDKTVPFLLFNLSIRGINGNVIHCNSLTREAKAVYLLTTQNSLSFSNVEKLPLNKLCAEVFNLKVDIE